MRVVRSTWVLLALAVLGLVLIDESFWLPVEPVTTCIANLSGVVCTVHYLEGNRVVSCGIRPDGGPVSCIQSLWWINPLPFLYFKGMEIRMVGVVLFLSGTVGYALRIFMSSDSQSHVRSQDGSPLATSGPSSLVLSSNF